MKGYVYILKKDQKNKFYIGSTNDIKRRLKQHKNKHTYTTYRMALPKLVLLQEYDNLEIARKIERKIKKLKRKDYIEKMVADGYIKINILKSPHSSMDRVQACGACDGGSIPPEGKNNRRACPPLEGTIF